MLNIVDRFLASARRAPDDPALSFAGGDVSYGELLGEARRIARALDSACRTETVTVWADKSLSTYAGVLGALLSGKTFVPLNPRFPLERTQAMLRASGADTVVASAAGLSAAMRAAVNTGAGTIICPDKPAGSKEESLAILGRDCLHTSSGGVDRPERCSPKMYIMFTSGSTGRPKGVPVLHANVEPYLDTIAGFYGLSSQDRCSQLFDLTFDLSVHDLFATWQSGACLCVPTAEERIFPARYIQRAGLTSWFSVPSLLLSMARLKQLGPDSFPGIRVSLFCGEGLPHSLVRQWAVAAPNAIIENLYGPTECTIAISRHAWSPGVEACVNGLVPMGRTFIGQHFSVRDESGEVLPAGSRGELWLSGSQLTPGYLDQPEQTAKAFAEEGGRRWYRTGDLVLEDEDGTLHFIERIDHQVKIRGYRVELVEIENHLAGLPGVHGAVVSPARNADGVCVHLHAFIVGSADPGEVLLTCRTRFPDYMVPRRVEFLTEFPLNANGKIDRPKLEQKASNAYEHSH
ncbi:amino acid adenylation domain-containing protein [Fundidesulfovibrio soli]|uniref:amino acid adenylation domain-containing protein n=1 Tax=Fundidesulfovibrio soli TaxID=2922716 RepID=UPI001FAE8980|nr:amino acid adenylation domain-containing protein [Fundidesulfovibrio soli]